jgi:hypothetical protein
VDEAARGCDGSPLLDEVVAESTLAALGAATRRRLGRGLIRPRGERRDRAGEEAGRAQRGVPVGGREVELEPVAGTT